MPRKIPKTLKDKQSKLNINAQKATQFVVNHLKRIAADDESCLILPPQRVELKMSFPSVCDSLKDIDILRLGNHHGAFGNANGCLHLVSRQHPYLEQTNLFQKVFIKVK